MRANSSNIGHWGQSTSCFATLSQWCHSDVTWLAHSMSAHTYNKAFSEHITDFTFSVQSLYSIIDYCDCADYTVW